MSKIKNSVIDRQNEIKSIFKKVAAKKAGTKIPTKNVVVKSANAKLAHKFLKSAESRDKASVRKLVVKKTIAPINKKLSSKKVVDVTPTIEQRLKEKSEEFESLSIKYNRLYNEFEGLRSSFAMVKANYEREKNRLDKVIDASLNNSKPLVVVKNNDYCLESK